MVQGNCVASCLLCIIEQNSFCDPQQNVDDGRYRNYALLTCALIQTYPQSTAVLLLIPLVVVKFEIVYQSLGFRL